MAKTFFFGSLVLYLFRLDKRFQNGSARFTNSEIMVLTIKAKNRVVRTSGALHRKESRFSRIRCWANSTSSPCAVYVKDSGTCIIFASFPISVGSFGRGRRRYLKFRCSQRIKATRVEAIR